MLNKKNISFITLFSLILILGVYYLTIPNEVLEGVDIKKKIGENVVTEVVEESSLNALRVSKEMAREEKKESLENALTEENLSTVEKNNTIEMLKYLNEIEGKEENIEKEIKKNIGLDCFTKIDQINVSVICIADKHDKSLANKIMRLIQAKFKNKVSIIVKFQKK